MSIYKRCKHGGRERDRCSDNWYASYKIPGQPRARVSVSKWAGEEIATKGQALAVFDDLKRAVRTGTFDPRGRGVTVSTDAPITFAKLVELYEDKYVKGRKLRTAEDFKYRAKPLLARFGPLPITQIRRADIDDFQATLRQPRLIHGETRQPSKATVNRPVSLLRGVLNWAVGHEYLPFSPFRRSGVSVVRLDREDNNRNRRISSEEEDRLLAGASPDLRALIILALDTGMRAGEMLAIRVCDVDLDRGEIRLRGVTTKSAKTRVLPIATQRLRAVIEWLGSLRTAKKVLRAKRAMEPLVSNEAGEELAGFRTTWTTAILKAHGHMPTEDRPLRDKHTARLLPCAREALRRIDLHWHDLRHEYACRLAERGVPVTKIQALLGHASVTTTMRYIHHTLDELARATTVLETGAIFDPTVGPRVSVVSQTVATTQNAKPETIM